MYFVSGVVYTLIWYVKVLVIVSIFLCVLFTILTTCLGRYDYYSSIMCKKPKSRRVKKLVSDFWFDSRDCCLIIWLYYFEHIKKGWQITVLFENLQMSCVEDVLDDEDRSLQEGVEHQSDPQSTVVAAFLYFLVFLSPKCIWPCYSTHFLPHLLLRKYWENASNQ